MAIGVPPEFEADLESVAFQTGIYRSWLAAVCELAGWNPFLETLNVPSMSIRRFGIAGIWARLEDVILRRSDIGDSTGFARNCEWAYAGWFSGGFESGIETTSCFECKRMRDIGLYRPIRNNMLLAAEILQEAGTIVQTLCGEYNSLIFIRWMWGCRWIPWNNILGEAVCDVLPPGIPDLFAEEVQELIRVQKLYAEQYGEPPIVPDTYLLTVTSQNVMGATFRLDSVDYATPASIDVTEGEHALTAVDTLVGEYEFKGWWIQGVLHEVASVAISVYSPMSIVMAYALSGEPPTPPPGGMGMGLGLLLAGVAVTGGGVLLYKQEMERRKRGGR